MYGRSFYSPYSSSFFPGYSPYYRNYNTYGCNYSPYSCRSFYPYCRYPCASFCPPRCSRVEYIPVQKSCIEYAPQTRVEYVPCERRYTDYMQVQHDIDYVPVPRVEKYMEYVPQERYQTTYDYQPMHRSSVIPKRQSMHEHYADYNYQPYQQQNLYNSFGNHDARRSHTYNDYDKHSNLQHDNKMYAKQGLSDSDDDNYMKKTAAHKKSK